jgi:spermidine synthase
MTMRFAGTIFVSAVLLFLLEPIVAKMVLPLLGGAPAVWNTCMLFFQAVLLAGYVYAHATTRLLGVRRQAILHVVVVALPLFVLPFGFREEMTASWPQGDNPALRLLGLLTVQVGLPFFVVSTSAPVLQKWFSSLGGAEAKDPYFLYGASNIGSMLALAAYPLLLEPRLGLGAQSRLWQVGYALFVALVGVCAVAVWMSKPGAAVEPVVDPSAEGRLAAITGMRRLKWVALAFVPSSLLLGVTSYISTDVASVPLLWVVPLALYLATFIFVFAKKPPRHETMVRLLPFGAILAVGVILAEVNTLGWVLIVSHLGTFFVACMVCHGALAKDRPAARHLTEFYLLLSVGGVLGGIFNNLIAPFIFDDIVEYPLAIVLACFCRAAGRPAPQASERKADIAFPLILGAITGGAALIVRTLHLSHGSSFAIVFALPLFAAYSTLEFPRRFASSLGAILVASLLYQGLIGHVVFRERNFFGVLRVSVDPTGKFMQIAHGTTIHGVESLDPALRNHPTGYYHPTGPAGQIFARDRGEHGRVAIIGLGCGAMSPYARPGENWTYYEINPAVVRVAQDPKLFTFLSKSFPDGRGLKVEVGDGRLRLAEAPEKSFDLVIFDAFSSDAIPVHLVTREAIRLYVSKLSDRGVIALNISNRYLDLEPMLADLARDAGLFGFTRADLQLTPEQVELGKFGSIWFMMTRTEAEGAALLQAGWRRTEGKPTRRIWTDDFSNLLSVLR